MLAPRHNQHADDYDSTTIRGSLHYGVKPDLIVPSEQIRIVTIKGAGSDSSVGGIYEADISSSCVRHCSCKILLNQSDIAGSEHKIGGSYLRALPCRVGAAGAIHFHQTPDLRSSIRAT
jgi:hypothetical protein